MFGSLREATACMTKNVRSFASRWSKTTTQLQNFPKIRRTEITPRRNNTTAEFALDNSNAFENAPKNNKPATYKTRIFAGRRRDGSSISSWESHDSYSRPPKPNLRPNDSDRGETNMQKNAKNKKAEPIDLDLMEVNRNLQKPFAQSAVKEKLTKINECADFTKPRLEKNSTYQQRISQKQSIQKKDEHTLMDAGLFKKTVKDKMHISEIGDCFQLTSDKINHFQKSLTAIHKPKQLNEPKFDRYFDRHTETLNNFTQKKPSHGCQTSEDQPLIKPKETNDPKMPRYFDRRAEKFELSKQKSSYCSNVTEVPPLIKLKQSNESKFDRCFAHKIEALKISDQKSSYISNTSPVPSLTKPKQSNELKHNRVSDRITEAVDINKQSNELKCQRRTERTANSIEPKPFCGSNAPPPRISVPISSNFEKDLQAKALEQQTFTIGPNEMNILSQSFKKQQQANALNELKASYSPQFIATKSVRYCEERTRASDKKPSCATNAPVPDISVHLCQNFEKELKARALSQQTFTREPIMSDNRNGPKKIAFDPELYRQVFVSEQKMSNASNKSMITNQPMTADSLNKEKEFCMPNNSDQLNTAKTVGRNAIPTACATIKKNLSHIVDGKQDVKRY